MMIVLIKAVIMMCSLCMSGTGSMQPTSGLPRLSDLANQKHPAMRRLGDQRSSPTESLANTSQISTSSRTTSQEITTLRPRSGKEYQRINRRRLGSASGSDTSPATLNMTPHSPASPMMKAQVFTFDNLSRGTDVMGTDSPRRDAVSRGRLSTSTISHPPEPPNCSPQVQYWLNLLLLPTTKDIGDIRDRFYASKDPTNQDISACRIMWQRYLICTV